MTDKLNNDGGNSAPTGNGYPSPDGQVAAEALVRDNIEWMLRLATTIVQNPNDAQDAVQNAFEQALKNIDQFEGRADLKTWLHRITVNAALMKLRGDRRRETNTIDSLQPEFDEFGCRIESPYSELTQVEQVADDANTRQRVFDALNQVPEDYRVVLLLRDIEGYSTREVAELLDISEQNAKVRLHRARAALKKLLEPVLRGEESGQ